jgi:hypothetical protein
MDPNTALSRLRFLTESILSQVEDGVADWDNMQEMAQQFEALDEWMSKGGFLPTDWHPIRTSRQEEAEHFGGLR